MGIPGMIANIERDIEGSILEFSSNHNFRIKIQERIIMANKSSHKGFEPGINRCEISLDTKADCASELFRRLGEGSGN